MAMKTYTRMSEFKSEEINFTLGADRHGKPQITMYYNPNASEVALVSPACVTNWPRVTGDGNYGTMWGPSDIHKAKFTLDLTDTPINGASNAHYEQFARLLNDIDDRLLDFVQANQLKLLGRKNLTRDEIKMLQIRTVRPKYDKTTGALVGHSVQMSASKYAWDGCGGKYARTISVCDHTGAVVTNGVVQPGDVVAATMYANQVYTGVGGDKFGIHWSFEDVQVVCQRSRLAQKTEVAVFGTETYDFAMAYVDPVATVPQSDYEAQFSEPIAVA